METRQDGNTVKESYVTTLRADDTPSESNAGVVEAGLVHLERKGFREGERVRVTVTIETVGA